MPTSKASHSTSNTLEKLGRVRIGAPLDLFKRGLCLLIPLKPLGLENFGHGAHYGAKILHKSPIERG